MNELIEFAERNLPYHMQLDIHITRGKESVVLMVKGGSSAVMGEKGQTIEEKIKEALRMCRCPYDPEKYNLEER